MKKIMFLLICTMLLPTITEAKKSTLRVFDDCMIYGQSGRNSEKKGSALSLTTGLTYSLAGANDNTYTKYIDVMLFFGKTDKIKTETFHLFAPEDPTLNIDWDADGGTKPYNKFVGKSEDPDDIYYALRNWKVRNFTKLKLVTGEVDYDNATDESIAAMEISDSYIVSNLKIGDIILFELAPTSPKAGKKGLIKITGMEDDPTKPEQKGNGKYQRFILSIKIQK